jgi:hypothetical protein
VKSPGDPKTKPRAKKKGDENAFASWVESHIAFVKENVVPKVGKFLSF